ncbi:hypothetical protein IV203_029419 [Nitzschia inconspicua]|uniref:C-CAP/cofactor C-like domain-containing protein n=1 Tax=Nitzschia inconspicua TaxID=303405 RepID=A0A9K3Q3A1_9STRA|nr:hypothetical protein IV203_029419 [Nitzschia inconspicua]
MDSSRQAGPSFQFHRYRAELAKRQRHSHQQLCGDELDSVHSPLHRKNVVKDGDASTSALSSTSDGASPPSTLSISTSQNVNILENVSNSEIFVHANGNVGARSMTSTSQGSNSSAVSSFEPKTLDIQSTLLLRNLQFCHINIRSDDSNPPSLPALHMDNVHHTSIHVQWRIATTIHVTKAVDSQLKLKYAAQQLRIHQAGRLQVVLEGNDNGNISAEWNKGSIILEHSKHVNFVVPSGIEVTASGDMSSNELDFAVAADQYWRSVIKDFGWLRAGSVSPNFTIQFTSSFEENGDNSIHVATETVPMPHHSVDDESSNAGTMSEPTMLPGLNDNISPDREDDDDDEL